MPTMSESLSFWSFIFTSALRLSQGIEVPVVAVHRTWAVWLSNLCVIGSALAGIYGSYLLGRRYVQTFLTALSLALVTPIMTILGKGSVVKKHIQSNARDVADVPESPVELVFGLNYLVWAFFGQLLALFFSLLAGT